MHNLQSVFFLEELEVSASRSRIEVSVSDFEILADTR